MKTTRLVFVTVLAALLTTVGSAEEFGGGEMHTVTEGDSLVADNGWGIEIDRITGDSVSAVLISDGDDYYTTTLEAESQSDLTNGVRSPKEVLSVTVESTGSGSATVRVDAIEDDSEEEEEPPTPPGEDDSEEDSSTTFEGDGIYNLEPGDRIATDRGYTVELKSDQSLDDPEGSVEVILYGKDGNQIPLFDYRNSTFMGVSNGISKMDSRGLNVDILDIYPSNNTLQMRATSNMVIRLNEGWNLISSPLQEESNIVRNTCGDTDQMNFWGLDSSGRYFDSGLTSKNGVWLEASKSCKIVVEGSTFSEMDVELDEGWNLIGAPTSSVDFDAFQRSVCNIESGPWGYRPVGYRSGYYEAAQLEAGQGYFIKVSEQCTLDEMRVPGGAQ
jgi:hypothetical protein